MPEFSRTKMIHVMHVIDTLSMAGAQRMLVDIANSSFARGIRVSVCVTRSGMVLAKELHPEICVYVLQRSSRFDPKGFCRLAFFVDQQKPDVFHVHSRTTLSFLFVAFALGLTKQPVIMHDHFGVEIDLSVPAWLRYWGKNKIDHYVGVYEKLALWAQEAGVPREKISVIGNALDLSRIKNGLPLDLRQELQINDETLIGVFVGRICPEKGLDILLDVIAQSQYRQRVKILVVGTTQYDSEYYEECQIKSKLLNVNDIVLFMGERVDIPAILKSVDFALISSRSESGPLVLIEYLTTGLPFVATNVGGISSQVAKLRVPEFVSPDDVGAFVAAFDRLISLSHKERLARGMLGEKVAFLHFDIQQEVNQWCELYSKLLTDPDKL